MTRPSFRSRCALRLVRTFHSELASPRCIWQGFLMLLLHGTTLCPVRNPTKKENSLMTTGCDQFAFGFQPLKQREIRDEFPGGAIRSDGSGLLLREVEKRTGILRQFGHRCTDFRNPDLIAHTVEDM